MKTKILQFFVIVSLSIVFIDSAVGQSNEMPHIQNIEMITRPANTTLFVGSYTAEEGHQVKIISSEYFAFLSVRMRELVEYSKYYVIEE